MPADYNLAPHCVWVMQARCAQRPVDEAGVPWARCRCREQFCATVAPTTLRRFTTKGIIQRDGKSFKRDRCQWAVNLNATRSRCQIIDAGRDESKATWRVHANPP